MKRLALLALLVLAALVTAYLASGVREAQIERQAFLRKMRLPADDDW